MKNLVKASILVLALFAFNRAGASAPLIRSTDGNYQYQNAQMHFQIEMPIEWKDKIKVDETENSTTFSYLNGTEKVFLFSVNKLSETDFLNVRDQLGDITVVAHPKGQVLYAEKTSKDHLKGANKDEFSKILQGLDAVIANIHYQD